MPVKYVDGKKIHLPYPKKQKRTKKEKEKAERKIAESKGKLKAYMKASSSPNPSAPKGSGATISRTKSSLARDRKVHKLMRSGTAVTQGGIARPEEYLGAMQYLVVRDKQEERAMERQARLAGKVAKAKMRYKQKKRKRDK
jgi:hypothetical protein